MRRNTISTYVCLSFQSSRTGFSYITFSSHKSGPEALEKGSRPQELTEWINSARPWNDNQMKRIKDLERYAARFKTWWGEIQPEGRSTTEDGDFMQKEDSDLDWEDIRVTGKNGLWTAVAGLCFWGQALGPEGRMLCNDWYNCVTDLSWVLHELLWTSSPAGVQYKALNLRTNAEKEEKAKASQKSKAKARARDHGVDVDVGDSSEGVRTRSKRLREDAEQSSVRTRSSKRCVCAVYFFV